MFVFRVTGPVLMNGQPSPWSLSLLFLSHSLSTHVILLPRREPIVSCFNDRSGLRFRLVLRHLILQVTCADPTVYVCTWLSNKNSLGNVYISRQYVTRGPLLRGIFIYSSLRRSIGKRSRSRRLTRSNSKTRKLLATCLPFLIFFFAISFGSTKS